MSIRLASTGISTLFSLQSSGAHSGTLRNQSNLSLPALHRLAIFLNFGRKPINALGLVGC
jgi:hypothetical protein